MNKADLTPSLWLYSIHSKNADFIHFLESNKVDPPKFMFDMNYLACLIESIKCHHNDFAKYIESNLMLEQETESARTKEEILVNSVKYHNYSYFQIEMIKEKGFSIYTCIITINLLIFC